MTKKEKDILVKLLEKLSTQNLLIPNMPLDVWYAINRILPLPAVEVIVSTNGKDFLLTKRKDKFWDGWHIPGGFLMRKETLEKACNRVAKKEIGMTVMFKKLIGVHVWTDHPYANSLSLICYCTAKSRLKKGRFFTKIPVNIVPHHSEFIGKFLSVNSGDCS